MTNNSIPKKPIPKRGEMIHIIKNTVKPIDRIEAIPFHDAVGRVCAENIYSSNTLPNYPVSRFDGIAVRFADFVNGMPDTSHWISGEEYAYGNTGTAMPEGFDTVIAIEEVTIHDVGVEIRKIPEEKGELVNGIGGSLQMGELIISEGEIIAPAHIGLFASGGVSEVKIFAKPRIGIIPTGDELIPATDNVPDKKNIESNSHMIAAYINEWGGEANRYPITKDEPELITSTLKKAVNENDAVVIIAGSSLGTKDYTVGVLDSLGELVVPELAHGPGRKSSLSVIDDKPILGVAGPPLGAQITCDLYLDPFVSFLSRKPYEQMQKLEVVSDDVFIEHEVDFNERVHIYKDKDQYHIRSIFAHKPTRAKMQILSNGNFYRVAGTSCRPGSKTTVELLCPIESIPDHDLLPETLR